MTVTAKTRLFMVLGILVITVLLFGACKKPATPVSNTPATPAASQPANPPANPPMVGGPCTYAEIRGTAKIISVKAAPSDGYNCGKNAVQVIFDFVPSDPSAVSSYRLPNWKDTGQHFTVGGGMNPPKAWVDEQGLVEGSQQECIRAEETKGTCTPVIFSFPKISKTGWEKYCAEK